MLTGILKVLCIILLILLVLAAVIAAVLRKHQRKNTAQMRGILQKGMEQMRGAAALHPLDAGEFTDMRFYGLMKFHVEQYRAEGLGNLSVMTADMGFMQMLSFVLTPFEKNLPVCTMDFMYMFGSRKSYVEFYDLVGDPETAEYRAVLAQLTETAARYADLLELPAKENWYDKYLHVVMHKQLSAAEDARNEALFCDALDTYLKAGQAIPASTPEERAHSLRTPCNTARG